MVLANELHEVLLNLVGGDLVRPPPMGKTPRSWVMVIAEEYGVSARTPSQRTRLVRRLVALAVVAILAAGTVYLYSQRNVYRVALGPGEVTYLTVEVPMQRFGRAKSFAKQSGLPVRCTVSSPQGTASGVHVSVVETGHKVHEMWAKLRIAAAQSASRGRRRRSIEFTIDGEGDWPPATIIVAVK